jgi:hypothetical protein
MRRAPCAAAGAEAALLATERHQPFRVAVFAHHAHEAVFEHTAAQERIELLAHVAGQRAAFVRQARAQRGRVIAHQRVEARVFGRVARVTRRGRRARARGRSGRRHGGGPPCGSRGGSGLAERRLCGASVGRSRFAQCPHPPGGAVSTFAAAWPHVAKKRARVWPGEGNCLMLRCVKDGARPQSVT